MMRQTRKILASPYSRRIGGIGTRLRKRDKKIPTPLVDAEQESVPMDRTTAGDRGCRQNLTARFPLLQEAIQGLGLLQPSALHAKVRLYSSLDDARMNWKKLR